MDVNTTASHLTLIGHSSDGIQSLQYDLSIVRNLVQQPILPVDPFARLVQVTLVLTLNLADVDLSTFRVQLATELAAALGQPLSSVQIIRINSGSMIAEIILGNDQSGASDSASHGSTLFNELKYHINNFETSPLRRGLSAHIDATRSANEPVTGCRDATGQFVTASNCKPQVQTTSTDSSISSSTTNINRTIIIVCITVGVLIVGVIVLVFFLSSNNSTPTTTSDIVLPTSKSFSDNQASPRLSSNNASSSYGHASVSTQAARGFGTVNTSNTVFILSFICMLSIIAPIQGASLPTDAAGRYVTAVSRDIYLVPSSWGSFCSY